MTLQVTQYSTVGPIQRQQLDWTPCLRFHPPFSLFQTSQAQGNNLLPRTHKRNLSCCAKKEKTTRRMTKLSILAFFVVMPTITSAEIPERFLGLASDDIEERELFRSRCDVKTAWEEDIQEVHDRTEDPEIKRIAISALDIFEETKTLGISDSLVVLHDEEAAAVLQESLADFDAPAIRFTLSRIRRQITRGIFTSPEQRVKGLDKASQELSSVLGKTTGLLQGLLQGLLLAGEETVVRVVLSLWLILDLIQGVLFLIMAGVPLLLLRILGHDGEFVKDTVAFLVDVLFYAPLVNVLLSASSLIFAVIDLGIAITGGKSGSPKDARMDCVITRILRTLPRTVKVMARAQVQLAELQEAEP